MPPQGDFYRYECNVNFRYYYAVPHSEVLSDC